MDVSRSLAQPDNNTENPRDKPDVNTPTISLEKSQDKERSGEMTNELGDKDKNPVEKNDQPTDIVNIEELDSDDVPIGKRLAPGIAKRLKNIKGQAVGSSSAPSKSVRNKASDIISTSRKQASGKKIPTNIPKVPLDNILFHYMENVEKWKFVYQRRLTLERELRKDAFECKEKCDNKRSKEFREVYVRGRCVDFSPKIINRFLGINEEEQAEIKVSDNVICREITTKQVKKWPRKGNLSVRALSVKYAFLHIIGVANWVPTNHTSNIDTGLELKDTCKTLDETIKSCTKRKSKIEMLIKALSKEEGGLKSDGTDEEEENEDGYDASDDEDATNNDED
ncbi:uncharacterized protein LOC127102254 [Lathyrus oleraceus]|uniref:uncharacterized protein LOC127102254 n=1 Tax=Pisum sativum TaxID=3888 RepID=UPI0021CF6C15|nr:uncharacterized protein LOC127102254 [Pisum sativum]